MAQLDEWERCPFGDSRAGVGTSTGSGTGGNDGKSGLDFPKLWTIARMQLRLTDAEFGLLTPHEFFLLYDRWLENLEIEDARMAKFMCLYANAHSKKKFKPQDFMPNRRGTKKQVQTVEEQLAVARRITEAFGGTVKRKSSK